MKLFAALILLSLAPYASASMSRDLHEDANTVAEILVRCPAEYRKAAAIGERVTKVHFLSPRPANPKILVDTWTFSFTHDWNPAQPTPRPMANLIITRTTDNTGPLLPDQLGKITYNCKLFVMKTQAP